jgi:hypothetical protein
MNEFDQFQLPPRLFGQLYKENLVGLNEHQPAPVDDKIWLSGAEGGYRNGLLVLVRLPGEAVMGTEDRAYLENILKACRMDLADSLVINLARLPAADFPNWSPAPAPRYLWMVGVEPGDIALPARFPAFQVQQLGETTHLWTPPLSVMQDKETKTRLWHSLKQFFRIS